MEVLNGEAAPRLFEQIHESHQHQQRTQQGVEKELERGIDPVRPAPDTNHQIHRDQRGLEKNVEQHGVQRCEYTIHQARHDQERRQVLCHSLLDHFPARQHHQHGNEAIQHQEQYRYAVHTQVIVHREEFDPRRFFDKLHGRLGAVKISDQWQGHQQAEQCA